jgi:tetratricopeptide (TPR) repeat protein
VIVLDDLHWSDGASIELLAGLLRRGPDAPLLLALAFRHGQAARRLSTALAVAAVERIALKPLTEAQSAELLGGLDGRSATAIYRQCGGNPFYLEQLARVDEHGRLTATLDGNGAGAGGAGVPAAVAASLAEELASVGTTERLLLEGAAVAGEPFEPDLAAAIAEIPYPDGLAALDALLALDLVRPTAVPRRFTFRHPLVRRAVYESAPGGWRLAAHARAAAALAARGAGAAERAHHVEHSAIQGDEDAIALLLQAGITTAARAPDAAVHWFEATLRLLGSEDLERQVAVRVSLADALRSLGELDRCRTTLLEALDLLPADAVAQRAELTARCAAVEHWLGRHEDAHARLVRAWEELPDRSLPVAAALQIELAVDGLYELDFEQTVGMGRGALEASRQTGDRVLIAAAASALCLGEAAAGQIEAARERRAEAVELVDRLPDAELATRIETLYYLGWAENYLEHYDEAIAHVDRGIAIVRATGEGGLLIPMMLVKGYTLEMQGRVPEAIELCETAVEATRLTATPHDLFWALFELAFAHYHAGDLEAAIAAADESARVGGRLTGGARPARPGRHPAGRRRGDGSRPARDGGRGGRGLRGRAAARRVLARAGRPRLGRRGGSPAGDRGPAGGRARARRLRLAAGARPDAPRAAPAGRSRGATRTGDRGELRARLADAARARDRRPGDRPQDEPRDRRRAVPQREDDRDAHAQHLRQARRLLARAGRARRRARPARPRARRRA